MTMRNRLLLLSTLFVVVSCAAIAGARPKSVCIKGVPHVRQKKDFCGEACAAMWLRELGRPVDQDWVYDQSGLDPRKDVSQGRGCYTPELARALRKIGFKIGPVWHRLRAPNALAETESLWRALHADLVNGVPSVVCMHSDDRPEATEHFRLVLGYDAEKDEVIYHEPAESDGAYRRMTRSTFLRLWPLKSGAELRTVIRLRLEGDKLKRGAASALPTAADYAQHIMKLRSRIPSKEFTVVVQPPFVVIGDESPATVRRRSKSTVKWAVDSIRKLYFKKELGRIMDIWLFKDKTSYRKYTKSIFNDSPTTPFGYCSQEHGALIMNIATGGGTLVHEICHPFMHADFPQCPSWFDEGLASLYEQCGRKNGRIWGYTNWRLADLQKAIREKRVPSFKKLCSTSRREFYHMDTGTNYGQARYLCYYLQQKGLLVKFYRAFHEHHEEDPSGYATLMRILGRSEKEMASWRKEWEAWVLSLKYP